MRPAAQAWTLQEIADELGVAESSVSRWVRDVEFEPRPRARMTGIPVERFGKPYRAVPDPSIRTSKHPRGCPSIHYYGTRVQRGVMGLVHALLSSDSVVPG